MHYLVHYSKVGVVTHPCGAQVASLLTKKTLAEQGLCVFSSNWLLFFVGFGFIWMWF